MPCRKRSKRPWAPGREAGRDRAGPDLGYITAEAAVVIPALVTLLALFLWGLGAVGVQARCQDAARAGARAAARGEPEASVLSVALAAAPGGADVRVEREGTLHRVSVEATALGPGPLAVPVTGEAVAHAEPG
ncbi:TadE family type IV pilus minor pilin [Streptomyces sp. SBT349]|uniref:TadE family type IV pilus minor pilin n=1 Tax=Streptomyces sp. SBT349 TaxID=1580539 RepID=UPI00066B94B2|nr:TadE family type IV pilus minor pilin [Streptomyces sp. SBT349]